MSSVRADIKSVQLVESTCIYTARVCLLTCMYLLLDYDAITDKIHVIVHAVVLMI